MTDILQVFQAHQGDPSARSLKQGKEEPILSHFHPAKISTQDNDIVSQFNSERKFKETKPESIKGPPQN